MTTAKWIPIAAFCWLLATIGCSRYDMAEVRGAFAEGQHDRALNLLDKKAPDKPQLPYLFERGLLSHYSDRYVASNQAFLAADIVAEDLYTRSISRELSAFLTSDNTRPYAGTRYERLMIHYYAALNYLYLNEPDEALVECRRAEKLLLRYADDDPNYSFAGAAFLAYLSGLLHETMGDWNDAYIAYRWAEAGYARYAEKAAVHAPKELGQSLVGLARRLDFQDEAARYREKYGEPPDTPPNSGELVLIYETGFVPQKQESNILLPIFKTDRFLEKEEEIALFVPTLIGRRNLGYDEVSLEYLLRVAIPELRSNRPRLSRIDAEAAGVRARGALVEDVQAATMATFASEQGVILVRTVLRGLTKYLAYRRAKKQDGILGVLVNAVNVGTERADTRAWETLPNQIHVVRMTLPAGIHEVRLTFSDSAGHRVRTELLTGVKIRPNRKTFLNHRTFE